MDFTNLKYLVAGAGPWGAVIAERIATVLNEQVLVIDKRDHIGGNCFSKKDPVTGIDQHLYGTHVFHTDYQEVWDYVSKFTSFNNYRHKVLAHFKGKLHPIPINLTTINQFYERDFSPEEARIHIQSEASKNSVKDDDFESLALNTIGGPLYEAFIKSYTEKHWGIAAKNLPSKILSRIPIRFDTNPHYFHSRYQGIPSLGYSHFFSNMLKHSNISTMLNTNFHDIKKQIPESCLVIFSGPIDEFFNYKFGRLGWRSLKFETQILLQNNFQNHAVINHPSKDIAYTRIHEYKHLHPETKDLFDKTLISYEYPKTCSDTDTPYYPIETQKNISLFKQYQEETKKVPRLITGGRLGSYRYLNMDECIHDALATFEQKIKAKVTNA